MKEYRTIIFDFDGTVADSMSVLLRVYASLSDELGLRELKSGDVANLRNMKPFDVLRFIGVSIFRLPQLVHKARSRYKDFLSEVVPISGMPFVLMELQKKYHLHILTSNEQSIVLSFLTTNEITCFESVTSEWNFFGKDNSLKKMLKQLKLLPDDVLYIGDEVRDITACQKAGVDICSVSWGLNTEEILKKQQPTYLINDPDELLKLLI